MNHPPITDWPEHAAAEGTHRHVWEQMEKHHALQAGLAIGDFPCGAGLFSARLSDAGLTVVATDIVAVEPFKASATRRVLADGNTTLPFADASFDLLVSIEGIEHVENPSLLLREFARVLKPGGKLFLSTPNVDSLRSRIVMIWKGYHKYFGPVDDCSKVSGHLLPIDMIFLRGAARRAGLQIVDVSTVPQKRDHGLARTLQEWLRPALTKHLPEPLRGPVPFFGDVIVYVLTKPKGVLP